MSFISYAQNFEDVMLWRALKHLPHGFYIDIGAAWPSEHSVTKAFYDRGWRGINVEPNPKLNQQLHDCRPHDTNLCLAIGAHEGILGMDFLDDTGLSTLDKSIAERHKNAGWHSNRQDTQVCTLAAVWEQHVPTTQAVHFLKIDVEGYEEIVLRSNDWTRYRPWIVVVEATLPLLQIESYEGWEPILVKAGYCFAYADGLNRFYVSQERQELLAAFKYPPNTFDEFRMFGQQAAEVCAAQADARAMQAETRAMQAETRAMQAETRAAQAETRAAQAETRAAQAETRAMQADARAMQADARAAQAETRVNDLIKSTSWRISAPWRWLTIQVRQLRPHALKSKLKTLFQHLALYVSRRAWLKRIVLGALAHLSPPLRDKLEMVVSANKSPIRHMPTEMANLTPRARQIYTNLKSAFATVRQDKL